VEEKEIRRRGITGHVVSGETQIDNKNGRGIALQLEQFKHRGINISVVRRRKQNTRDRKKETSVPPQ
jgi:hypothetical protein